MFWILNHLDVQKIGWRFREVFMNVPKMSDKWRWQTTPFRVIFGSRKQLYDTTNSKLHDAWRGLTAWDACGKTFRRTWVQRVTGPLTEVLLGRLALSSNGQWCRECSVDPSVFSEKESVQRTWIQLPIKDFEDNFSWDVCVPFPLILSTRPPSRQELL